MPRDEATWRGSGGGASASWQITGWFPAACAESHLQGTAQSTSCPCCGSTSLDDPSGRSAACLGELYPDGKDRIHHLNDQRAAHLWRIMDSDNYSWSKKKTIGNSWRCGALETIPTQVERLQNMTALTAFRALAWRGLEGAGLIFKLGQMVRSHLECISKAEISCVCRFWEHVLFKISMGENN